MGGGTGTDLGLIASKGASGAMGGKGSSTSSVSPQLQANETALVNIASEDAAQGQQLFNLAEPGVQSAENYYTSLASGDPAAIARAISPAAQQVNLASVGAKKNILASPGGGGEKNLALEQVDVNKGEKIGELGAGATTGAYSALARLGAQGIGESANLAGTAISGYSAGDQALVQNAQLQMEQKGQSLWPVGAVLSGGAKGSSALGQVGNFGGGGGAVSPPSSGGGGGFGGYGTEGMDSSGGLTFGGDTGSDFGTFGGYDASGIVAA